MQGSTSVFLCETKHGVDVLFYLPGDVCMLSGTRLYQIDPDLTWFLPFLLSWLPLSIDFRHGFEQHIQYYPPRYIMKDGRPLANRYPYIFSPPSFSISKSCEHEMFKIEKPIIVRFLVLLMRIHADRHFLLDGQWTRRGRKYLQAQRGLDIR